MPQGRLGGVWRHRRAFQGLTTTPALPQTLSHTSAPIWDESASFLVKRPHAESLELQVRSEGGSALGSLSLPLPELLAAEQLCLDQWFALNNGQGQVLLRAQLRVSARGGCPGLGARGVGAQGWAPQGEGTRG